MSKQVGKGRNRKACCNNLTKASVNDVAHAASSAGSNVGPPIISKTSLSQELLRTKFSRVSGRMLERRRVQTIDAVEFVRSIFMAVEGITRKDTAGQYSKLYLSLFAGQYA